MAIESTTNVELRPPARGVRGRGRKIRRVADTASLALDLAALTIAVVLAGGPSPPTILYAVIAGTALVYSGDYRGRVSPTLSDSIPRLAGQLAMPILPISIMLASSREALELVHVAMFTMGLVIVGRGISYGVVREARRRGYIVEPTLIIGAGQQGVLLAETLQNHPEFGLLPVGYLDSFNDELSPPILGDITDLDTVLREFNIRRVVVAFGGTREPEMVRVLRTCDVLHIELYVMPRFFELGVTPSSPETEDIWGIPLVRLRRSALRTINWRTKRTFDITISAMALVLISPVFAAAALAVRLTSKGPIFFRQKRVGWQGRPVEVLKFRTMPVNNDSDTTWNVARDDRLTPVGRLLRRTSIDELPQLLNVFRGDMSIVGPRPERPFFVDQFDAQVRHYRDRHRVPVGITGWAQVHGLRGATSIEERARFDNYYIEHWSLWRDLVIIFRTLRASWQDPDT